MSANPSFDGPPPTPPYNHAAAVVTIPAAMFNVLAHCYWGGGPRHPDAPNRETTPPESHVSDFEKDDGAREPIQSVPLSPSASRPTLHPRGRAARILGKTDEPLAITLAKEQKAREAAESTTPENPVTGGGPQDV